MSKLTEYRPKQFRFKISGRYFYLSGLSKRDAERVHRNVELLASAKKSGSIIPDRVAEWLSEISDELHEKLHGFGLVDRREVHGQKNATVIEFAESYIKSKSHRAEGTLKNLRNALTAWKQCHPPGLKLREVTPQDAQQFYDALRADHKSSTASLYLRNMRAIFREAVNVWILDRNALEVVRAESAGDETQNTIIERDQFEKVLKVLPDAQWRLLFCLSRYGGLRCPSESDALKWEHVDFAAREIYIPDSKRKKIRTIPLFPELLEPLRDAFDPEAVFVLQEHRGSVGGWAMELLRRADMEPWSRFFHSMRASRESELAAEYPIHVVCEWIGNTPKVAKKHYLKVMQAEMEKAKGCGEGADLQELEKAV